MHNRVIKIIKAIRLSFLEAGIVYTRGACYGFYTILKSIFPKAEAYMTDDQHHIVTKIGNKYYDVLGEFINSSEEKHCDVIKLNERQHNYWEAVISTQRIEKILKKK